MPTLAWRGSSCKDCQGAYGEDLSGGYYEAGGSYMKMALQEAFVLTQLAWTVVDFQQGLSKAGQLDEALAALRWGASYLMACHPQPNVFMAVQGNHSLDFEYYGPPEDYEQWVPKGPGGRRLASYINASNPSSEIAGEAAAALAATALAFASSDPAYAGLALAHSVELFMFGTTYLGSYMTSPSPGIQQHALLYPSSGFHDELAWAAVWLYRATGASSFLDAASNLFLAAQADGNSECCGYGTFSWDTKSPGVALQLATLQPNNSQYLAAVEQFFSWYLPGPGRTVPHTNSGLAYPYQGWGACRYAANAGMLALAYAQSLRSRAADASYAAQLFNYGQQQVSIILGSSGQSYLVGFGANFPQHVFQKDAWNSYLTWDTSSLPWTVQREDFQASSAPNPFIAYGAVVGGPSSLNGTSAFPDTRRMFQYTEPALDYGGGLIGGIAILITYYADQRPASMVDAIIDVLDGCC
ncbi:hypothetical protein WJX81_004364 [Elliptochloris bilobata]|uniref:cellulase n=1 Tax=Elliptochloris bilobata TaxID=381761 RepID=A0AAW1QNK5_9CHLO